MGLYLKPRDCEKQEWAEEFGKEVRDDLVQRTAKVIYSMPVEEQTDKLVCLVTNGSFSALGVAYDEKEFERFNCPDDKRPKKWFIVPTWVIKTLCPDLDDLFKRK